MRLTAPQFTALCFVIGWVAGQVIKADYQTCLYLASLNAFIGGYLNDVHKILWASIAKAIKRPH